MGPLDPFNANEAWSAPAAGGSHLVSLCPNTPVTPRSHPQTDGGQLDSLSRCCRDDHLGHLWMNHENKLKNSEQLSCLNSVVLHD